LAPYGVFRQILNHVTVTVTAFNHSFCSSVRWVRWATTDGSTFTNAQNKVEWVGWGECMGCVSDTLSVVVLVVVERGLGTAGK
jgi:uncharacterized lipoprotein NlpE involved in copper resistance